MPNHGLSVRSKTFELARKGSLQRDERRLCKQCEYLARFSRSQDEVRYCTLTEADLKPDQCDLCSLWQGAVDAYSKAACTLSLSINVLRYYPEGNVFLLFLRPGPTLIVFPRKLMGLEMGWKINSEQADFGQARRWMKLCRDEHGATCGSRGGLSTMKLKVIDCYKERIVQITGDQPYVTLSYVWGGHTPSNDDHIRLQQGLLPENIPRTIKDAMVASKELGISYLWVDRWCIDQDDPIEKHYLISNMDKVYAGAECTIIAAVGESPLHGLPGVSVVPRTRQLTVKIGSTEFLSVLRSPEEDFCASVWNTRGWTYQEMLLSRRRLVFTNSRMYFQCQTAFCSEGLVNPRDISSVKDLGIRMVASPFSDRPLFPREGIGKSPFELYTRVQEFYQRDLSFDSDILNAFSGILNGYRGTSEHGYPGGVGTFMHHFHGIPIFTGTFLSPTSSFLFGLAFYVRKSQRREGVWPSWSWTSFKQGQFLFMDYTLSKGFQSSTAGVTINRRDGTSLDVPTYSKEAHNDSLEYSPWINITAFAIEVHFRYEHMTGWVYASPNNRKMIEGTPYVLRADFNDTPKWSSLEIEVYWDHNHDRLGERTTAVYLGCINDHLKHVDPRLFFLLVRLKRDPDVFERVGLLKVRLEPKDDFPDRERLRSKRTLRIE